MTTKDLLGQISKILSRGKKTISDMVDQYINEISIDHLRTLLGTAWSDVSQVYANVSESERIEKNLMQIKGALGGTVTGIGAGALLGGGGVGIVALGGAIGIPLIAITGLVGLLVGERGGRELDFFRRQWKGAADRTEVANKRLEELCSADTEEQVGSGALRIFDKEHYEELLAAFVHAERAICIRSAFVSSYVIDRRFVELTKDALLRGVNVYIEYGYRLPNEILKQNPSRDKAVESLREIYRWCRANQTPGNFILGDTPTHIKELIVDDDYIIIGSNNWLSNRSFKNKEVSIKLHDRAMCVTAFQEMQESMQHYAKGQ